MFKKEIFSKVVKDYNNQLEEILEKKTFSLDVKNLLLSMLYKIENGYQDYSTVKRNVCKKKDFVENMITIIDKKCKQIELIKLDIENNILYTTDEENGKITCLQNEKVMLDAILDMTKKEIYIEENDQLISIAMKNFLRIGSKINNAEVIRDFNGWSWDISVKEMDNIAYNVLYQNLIILLGNEFMESWVNDIVPEDMEYEESKKIKPVNYILSGRAEKIEIDNFISSQERENSMTGYIEKMQEELTLMYGEKLARKIRVNLEKTILALLATQQEEEKKKIKKEKAILEKELKQMQDKKQYLNAESERKKKIAEEIKNMDQILNDKKLLKQEYEAKNKKLSNEEKIFSVNYYKSMLEKQRETKVAEMKAINKRMEPQEYVKMKTILEEKVKFFRDIVVEGKEDIQIVKERMIDFQLAFLECYLKKVQQAEENKEITECIYIFRYYLLLPLQEGKSIYEEEKLQEQIDNIKYILIQKACKQKVLTTFSEKDEKLNVQILQYILISKMIRLEEMIFMLNYQKDILTIEVYDESIHETTIPIKITQKTELSVKLNKKIKVWA